MKKEHEINALLAQLQATEGTEVAIDSEAVQAEYQKINANRSGIAIKVLTILGGLLATLAFLAFLLIAGLYDSYAGMTIIGIIFIAGAIVVSKRFDILIFDAIAVTAFASGLFLLAMGIEGGTKSENLVCILFIGIGLATLAIVQNYILSFLAVLTVNGALICLILFNNQYSSLHFYIAIVTIGLITFMLQEANLITGGKKLSRLYNPIKLGLLFSVLAAYVLVSTKGLFSFSIHFNLVSSIAAIGSIFYVLQRLLQLFNIQRTDTKVLIYLPVALVLIPTLYAPAIAGALLITLLCFWVNHKTGLVIGIAALVYFIFRYYYDLQLTLLVKSILLFASGVLFLLFYLLTHKKLESHEKI
ncbi:MAG: DUF4401 domain-containing protein [Niastella sp.]|nr:DUF4401 domain-containing protein [Niastella sp.]